MESVYPPSPVLSSRSVVTLASLSALLASLDSAVNIAFPAITAAFSLDVTLIQWIVISYVLTYASLLLGCGRLADLWGHERVLTWGLAGSTLAFLSCSLAPTFAWLLVARTLQGVGVALVFAAAPALVTLAVPAETRGRALGIFQMSAAAGFALGPLLGGVLVDSFGWRSVYLFRVLPAFLLTLVAARRPRILHEHPDDQHFDLFGAVTLAGSVAGFLLALSRSRDLGWTSPLVLVLLLVASMCLAGFVVAEARVSAPVVDLSLFRRPAFTVANLLNVLANCATFAIWLLVPYYIVNALGYSAFTGGVLLMTCPLATALAAPLAGWLSDRLGTSLLSTLGLGTAALGLWCISRLEAASSSLSVALTLALVGLGLGIFQTPNMSFIMGAIPRVQQGVAGSMSQMMRTLGVVLGVTGASMLFGSRRAVHAVQLQLPLASDPRSFMPAFQDVFVVAAIVCAVAFGLSLLRRSESSKSL
ncbi:MAG: MFS transporter [Deltaproteobacteria bacterium]|nr:MFS transporter [Deltaproteobacteria bacterium]